MKEFSIEEKAKAYDEAIERAKDMLSYKEVRREDMEYLFPELKESEDERTWIINYLSNRILNSTIIAEKENLKKAVAWVEKQGEQKSAEWMHKDGKNLAELWEILSVHRNINPQVDNLMEWVKDLVSYKRQEWSEEDKNMLQSILDEYKSMPTEKRNWLKFLKERYTWKPSDVQMGAIKDAIDYLGGNTKIVRKHLMSLYDQLKKLKG
jgi:hypothetical protein